VLALFVFMSTLGALTTVATNPFQSHYPQRGLDNAHKCLMLELDACDIIDVRCSWKVSRCAFVCTTQPPFKLDLKGSEVDHNRNERRCSTSPTRYG